MMPTPFGVLTLEVVIADHLASHTRRFVEFARAKWPILAERARISVAQPKLPADRITKKAGVTSIPRRHLTCPLAL